LIESTFHKPPLLYSRYFYTYYTPRTESSLLLKGFHNISKYRSTNVLRPVKRNNGCASCITAAAGTSINRPFALIPIIIKTLKKGMLREDTPVLMNCKITWSYFCIFPKILLSRRGPDYFSVPVWLYGLPIIAKFRSLGKQLPHQQAHLMQAHP